LQIFSALVRVGEEDGAAQQRAADRGCAANQRWGMAAAATPQSIIQRSSPSDAFSPVISSPSSSFPFSRGLGFDSSFICMPGWPDPVLDS